ncbi:hypothetical protein TVAG_047930 [Trichomonas vaginalis G3]|uniref:Cilia- and flagella-associated protein 36 n=1 Tax=Trichomonas vaginalis (strain ATCC PRA-98 / G3) TaxID=412133 RepID=A2EZH3_TRIV3|nr:phosphodiesterase HL family [Trichomonas vaginalis G3]EAY01939.1 hypothetical protein TVAG_047930 [Trichomonas vaginalis G3]KAI5506266.1 phosphodiesterase HL family [Trichomonas vaginalis G3]|eukprot:XP_001330454.1 hypothetical protein [Trichomonas vaginalis G3]
MTLSNTIYDSIIDFLSGEMWWGQLLDFMLAHCECFKPRDYSTVEEFNIYKDYCVFLEQIVEKQLCQNVKLTTKQFEQVILDGIENNIQQAISIKETLTKAVDFELFRRDMISHNERIEQEVQNVLSNEKESQNIINNEMYQVQPPNNQSSLPSLEIRSPRNPRKFMFNKASFISHAMKFRNPMINPICNPPQNPIQMNHGNLMMKHQNPILQSTNTGLPPLRSPRPPQAKLPPLIKSPRFTN